MNVIVDYGRGNLGSVKNAFDKIGFETEITDNADKIRAAKSIIIPGVGAFADAMKALNDKHLVEVLKEEAEKGKFILGICLGMQVLFDKGFEFGETEGLSLIEGTIKYMDIKLKVPHMGWNDLKFQKKDSILKYIEEGDYVYFVHSFYADTKPENVVAYAEYEIVTPGIVKNKNVYGIQFHPEKSGVVGERILRAYKEMVERGKI